ncbi:L-aspartate oxidase [Chelatococcus sp. SYSU_G07232]|uniref:L-aspartate oxidase n=1 Tax=Chelatococcus albus TaxID=3047466 RepID=A0ABT7AEL1_9HYPH|nr:L-aspartate oxidase [Chelatococcus sp. SYSU_G07232]MDJ1157801.1 L-aspartate oxidase [Chelatococcus sp. SYSU_G07232]
MTSTLIVGGGLAGLFTALKLAPLPCTVLSPRPLGEGASSAWAQGGIAAAVEEGDTPEAHAADTITAGAGLVDEAMARLMAREARERVDDLLAYGVPFDRTLEGRFVASREAAHSSHRVVRVDGDRAGKAIMAALVAAVRRTPSITVHEGFVAEALVRAGGRVLGVRARGDGGSAPTTRLFLAGATVLATGGIGHLYAVTTNPPEANGIGLALAAQAGAVIADPEFVQFHPTAIDVGRDPAPLATEALRGEGAVLVNGRGERFMQHLHPDAELAPRDVVARGVFAEIAAGRGAFLDARAAVGADFPRRFPTVHAACIAAGIDPVATVIPLAPAEHYHMGGIATDADGRTSLSGLWAAGEVACTGVHGANRLASNSLLEAVVFGARIAAAIKAAPPASAVAGLVPTPWDDRPGPPTPSDRSAITRLRALMQRHVGVLRDGEGLGAAVDEIGAIRRAAESTTLAGMATTAFIVAAAALLREESRGGHHRSDFPAPSEAFARRTMTTLSAAEAVVAGAAIPRARRCLAPDGSRRRSSD